MKKNLVSILSSKSNLMPKILFMPIVFLGSCFIFGQMADAQSSGGNSIVEERSPQRNKEPLSPDLRNLMNSQVVDLKKMLEECHQGKRDEAEKYVILKRMLRAYGVLELNSSTEATAAKKEWDELLLKHPELKKNPPTELKEQKEMAAKERAKENQISSKTKTFVPKDIRAKVYWSGNFLAAIYQFRVELYELPKEVEPFHEYGNEWQPLRAGEWQGSTIELRFFKGGQRVQLEPYKTITFGQKISVQGACKWSSKNCDYFALFSERIYPGYAFNNEEEREVLLKLKGNGKPYQWKNTNANYQEFYGVLSTDGKVVGAVPFKAEPPNKILQALYVYPDGTALFGVGGAIPDKRDLDSLRFGDVKEVVVWTKAGGISNMSIAKAIELHPVLKNSLWLK